MGKYFYGILFLVIFAIMVFAINILTEGGNESARAIFRFSGDNQRVKEISRAYREGLLGKTTQKTEPRDNPVRKNRRAPSDSSEKQGYVDTVPIVSLPRDPAIGTALDLSLSRIEITGETGKKILTILADATGTPIDEFIETYNNVNSVPDITQVPNYPNLDPLTVEMYQRRDRIQTAIHE